MSIVQNAHAKPQYDIPPSPANPPAHQPTEEHLRKIFGDANHAKSEEEKSETL